MNRKTFAQLFILFALLILQVFFSIRADAEVLPDKVQIKIGKREITGFRGDPDMLKETAARQVQGVDGGDDALPPEGFVFQEEEASRKFKVVAWSSKGDSHAILKAAEETLMALVEEDKKSRNEALGGYEYSGKYASLLGKEEVKGLQFKKKNSVVLQKSEEPMAVANAADPLPVLEAKAEPVITASSDLSSFVTVLMVLLAIVSATILLVRKITRISRR